MTGVTATFYGGYIKVYLQYIDASTGHTLVAEPGNTYDVALASGWGGRLAPVPADGSWGGGPPLFPAQFSAVPGFASPGAFFPASVGISPQPDSLVADAVFREEAELSPDEQWAQDAVDESIFGAAREQLDRAGEQLARLRRRDGK